MRVCQRLGVMALSYEDKRVGSGNRQINYCMASNSTALWFPAAGCLLFSLLCRTRGGEGGHVSFRRGGGHLTALRVCLHIYNTWSQMFYRGFLCWWSVSGIDWSIPLWLSNFTLLVHVCVGFVLTWEAKSNLLRCCIICKTHPTSIKGILSGYENSAIVYSPSCRNKPVWLSFFCGAQKLEALFCAITMNETAP